MNAGENKPTGLLRLLKKVILPPRGGRITLSANERIDELLHFSIQAKFAYVNKLERSRCGRADCRL